MKPKERKTKAAKQRTNRTIAVRVLREMLPSLRKKIIHWGGKTYRPKAS